MLDNGSLNYLLTRLVTKRKRKVSSFYAKYLKKSNFARNHSKIIQILFKTMDKYLILTQTTLKVLNFWANIRIVLYLVKNIGKESNFYPKHLKSISFCPKIIRNVSKFYPTCLESVFIWLKTSEKNWISAQHILKSWLCTQKPQNVSYMYTKTLKRICLWSKTFEKYLISTKNIWKVFEIASRHSRSIKISSKLCRKYRICTQNIWKHRTCNLLKKVSN